MIVVITGATAGLGLHCARALAADERVTYIVLACRRVAAARAALSASPKAVVLDAALDLASLSSVRAYAAALRAWLGERRLAALVANAGVGGAPGTAPTLTEDNFERIFQTNHLGHALLSLLLLPAMAPGAGRIVFVASEVHDAAAQGIPSSHMPDPESGWPAAGDAAAWDASLARGAARAGDGFAAAGSRRYSQSKLCNVLFAQELARRTSGAAPKGAPADVAAAAAALPGAAACALPGARALSVVSMNPGAMMDGNFVAGVAGPVVAAVAWALTPLLRYAPVIGRLMRSAAESGPVLAGIALPAAPRDDAAAYYNGPAVQNASAFARSAACACGHQQELWRRTLEWARVTGGELADAGFDERARR
jgi:NAD(P)-dependent dehydrogenase (short-subunit alcohol dehydrogenase family)